MCRLDKMLYNICFRFQFLVYLHMCVSILYVTVLKSIYYSPNIFAYVFIEI